MYVQTSIGAVPTRVTTHSLMTRVGLSASWCFSDQGPETVKTYFGVMPDAEMSA